MASLLPLASQLTFGSLGSGIGGADLGLISLGWTLAWQVERDHDKTALLAARWPDVPRRRWIEEAATLPSAEIVHVEPQAPEAEYTDPCLALLAARRPTGVIIDLASRRAADPLLIAVGRALGDLGYRASAALFRYQTCAIVAGRQHASHVRNRVVFLATLPPLQAPPDLGAEVRSILFSGVPAWDPALLNVAETALPSDVLEQVRLLPPGWTAAMPEPARFSALREATVPHFAALCGAALLGQIAPENI